MDKVNYKNHIINKTAFFPLLIGIITSAISLTFLQPYFATKNQIYYDLIVEFTARTNTNKSGELKAIWISLIVGLFSELLTMIYQKIIKKNYIEYPNSEEKHYEIDFIGVGVFIIPLLSLSLLTGTVNPYFLFIAIVYFLSKTFLKNQINPIKIVLLLIVTYYFLLSIKVILNFLIPSYEVIHGGNIYFFTLILFAVIFIRLKKNRFVSINKFIISFQLFIPVIFLNYLKNKYVLEDKEYILSNDPSYIIIIFLITVTLICINLMQIYKLLHDPSQNKRIKNIILFSSVITIFCLYYYSSNAFIHNGDFWHIGEEMIPWQQIIGKKLIPYKDYAPSSGMYGMITGFFQHMILNGTDMSFFPARALRCLFLASIIGTFTYFYVGSGFAIVIMSLIGIPGYNRPLVLFLSILILMSEKLNKDPIKWVQTYFILCILGGFYYPVNGVAFAIGSIPMVFVKIYLIFKNGLFFSSLKNVSFYLLGIVDIFLFLISFKTLYRMAKYILLLAGVSELADGITFYNINQIKPWFLQFLTKNDLRNTLWSTFVFSIIIGIILFLICLLNVYLFERNTENKDTDILSKVDSPAFYVFTSCIVVLAINYLFSLITMDPSIIFARTASIITVVLFLIAIIIYKYRLFNIKVKTVLIGTLLGLGSFMRIGSFILGPGSFIDVNNIGSEITKLNQYFLVPNHTQYFDGFKEGINNFGIGFLNKDSCDFLKNIKKMLTKTLKDNELFYPNIPRELLHSFDTATPLFSETFNLMLGKNAVKIFNTNFERKMPIVIISIFGINRNYPIQRKMLELGYIYCNIENIDVWLRKDRYIEIFKDENIGKRWMIDHYPQINQEHIPNSLGKSLNTLNNRFDFYKTLKISDFITSEHQINTSLDMNDYTFEVIDSKDPFIVMEFKEPISGNDCDYIYFEIETDATLKIMKEIICQLYFETKTDGLSENRSTRFYYDNGKLLVMIGHHPGWKLGEITKLRFDFENVPINTKFKIKEIILLKLKID